MLTSFRLGEVGETWTASSYEDEDCRLPVGASVRVTATSAEVLGESCLAVIMGRPDERRRKGCHAYLVRRAEEAGMTILSEERYEVSS